MALIKSISGIRGAVGGTVNEGFDPLAALKYSLAFGRYLQKRKQKVKVVVGRDSRPSGKIFSDLVVAGLSSLGIEVYDGGMISMPTLEMAVIKVKADGGVIISASHNPNGWNALKFLDENGEIFTKAKGEEVFRIADQADFYFADEKSLGKINKDDSFLSFHLKNILSWEFVNRKAIATADFRVGVDGINSVGGRDLPELLHSLGVTKIEKVNCDLSGNFAHDPEPLDRNLADLVTLVKEKKCAVGFLVDPDGDRLSVISEDGSFFNEEYVIVAVADYVLAKKGGGDTVSNLSSTRALKDVTEKYGGHYFPSAVGETNVVLKMKEVKAAIGGEGNGGVICPELHYGRDALIGVALFLSYLAESKLKCSELKKKLPPYFISKNKLELPAGFDFKKIFAVLEKKYQYGEMNKADGLRIDFEQEKEWLHLRGSNTEPIMRIYTESETQAKADALAAEVIKIIKENV